MSAAKRSSRIGRVSIFVLKVVGVLAIFAVMLQTIVNVMSRQLFNQPVQHTTELVSYWYLPAMVFLGYIIAKDRDEHIDAPLLFDRLAPASQRVLRIVTDVLVVAACLLFVVFTFEEAMHGFEVRETVGATTLILWPVMFLIPVAFAGLTVQYAIDIVRALAHPPREESLSESIVSQVD